MMYTPLFNSVLVEIDDEGAGWGSGNSDAMLGDSYSKGKAISYGLIMTTATHPLVSGEHETALADYLDENIIGKSIMWNEGVEAGTTWDEDGKKYGFIYWFDIRGVKVDDGK